MLLKVTIVFYSLSFGMTISNASDDHFLCRSSSTLRPAIILPIDGSYLTIFMLFKYKLSKRNCKSVVVVAVCCFLFQQSPRSIIEKERVVVVVFYLQSMIKSLTCSFTIRSLVYFDPPDDCFRYLARLFDSGCGGW